MRSSTSPPFPRDSVLVCTQLLNGGVVQEVSRPIPADMGAIWPLGIGCQTLEESMGLPRIPGSPTPTHYHTAGHGVDLLPPGVGTNAVRLKLLDGATVVFDQTFPY
jgi:hypothetical protein